MRCVHNLLRVRADKRQTWSQENQGENFNFGEGHRFLFLPRRWYTLCYSHPQTMNSKLPCCPLTRLNIQGCFVFLNHWATKSDKLLWPGALSVNASENFSIGGHYNRPRGLQLFSWEVKDRKYSSKNKVQKSQPSRSCIGLSILAAFYYLASRFKAFP